eukprot:4502697-Amphidinium_carterae.1
MENAKSCAGIAGSGWKGSESSLASHVPSRQGQQYETPEECQIPSIASNVSVMAGKRQTFNIADLGLRLTTEARWKIECKALMMPMDVGAKEKDKKKREKESSHLRACVARKGISSETAGMARPPSLSPPLFRPPHKLNTKNAEEHASTRASCVGAGWSASPVRVSYTQHLPAPTCVYFLAPLKSAVEVPLPKGKSNWLHRANWQVNRMLHFVGSACCKEEWREDSRPTTTLESLPFLNLPRGLVQCGDEEESRTKKSPGVSYVLL